MQQKCNWTGGVFCGIIYLTIRLQLLLFYCKILKGELNRMNTRMDYRGHSFDIAPVAERMWANVSKVFTKLGHYFARVGQYRANSELKRMGYLNEDGSFNDAKFGFGRWEA